MNILNIEHISLVYGDKVIFDDLSAGVEARDKIGIIGINGAGKSTLLKVVAGAEAPDSGQVVRQNNLRIAYLPQMPDYPDDVSLMDYVEDGNGLSGGEAAAILNSLGLTDPASALSTLSGGQKKRAALARVLVLPSDVLILDEPTNHLDQEMISWLEDYLSRYRGVVLMVTHDRYFLDKVTNKIWEVSHGRLYTYEANYSGFLEQKAARQEMEEASWRKKKSILRIELEWAARGCRARSTKQKARLMRLEDLKNARAPEEEATVQMESVGSRMGKKTIELSHVTKAYEGETYIRDFSYIFLKNQRVGIIGPNGCGKSTLLKLISGTLAPDSGQVETGDTIRMSVFSQTVPDMDDRMRVIDYIKDVAEYLPTKDGLISATTMLERFLFDSGMQYTPLSKLSGGEKRRLYLLKTLMEAPNVLLLDEPGNDLDIPTLTILEDYLLSFSGIVAVVSHDRYFLDNVADRILAFEGDGRIASYEGGYTDYREAIEKKTASQPENAPSPADGAPSGRGKAPAPDGAAEADSRKGWKEKGTGKKRFSYKEQKEYETIEETISGLEEKLSALEEDIARHATEPQKLEELMAEKEQTEQELSEKMDRWVYLQELYEEITSAKA